MIPEETEQDEMDDLAAINEVGDAEAREEAAHE